MSLFVATDFSCESVADLGWERKGIERTLVSRRWSDGERVEETLFRQERRFLIACGSRTHYSHLIIQSYIEQFPMVQCALEMPLYEMICGSSVMAKWYCCDVQRPTALKSYQHLICLGTLYWQFWQVTGPHLCGSFGYVYISTSLCFYSLKLQNSQATHRILQHLYLVWHSHENIIWPQASVVQIFKIK